MPTQQKRIAGATGKPVDVESLEAELSALWAEMTREDAGEHASVMRVCVLNLILVAGAKEERGRIDDLLEEVTLQHPCRAIVLLFDNRPDREEQLAAYVSTRCQLFRRHAKQICGEQVTIEANAASLERAASIITPLLVPDVPVFLFWQEIPPEDDWLFARLVRMSDRVVFDSAATSKPNAGLLRLANLVAARAAEIRASDLNWGRLTSWRALVAHLWDVADYRPHLETISRVRLDYNRQADAPEEISAQGLLVAGWLASRLGWELERAERSSNSSSFIMRAAGARTVRIELVAVEPLAGCERRISALTLASDETGAEFRIAWRPERTKLETSVRLGEEERPLEHLLAYEARSDGERLSRELSLLARDTTYEEALRCAARLIAGLA